MTLAAATPRPRSTLRHDTLSTNIPGATLSANAPVGHVGSSKTLAFGPSVRGHGAIEPIVSTGLRAVCE